MTPRYEGTPPPGLESPIRKYIFWTIITIVAIFVLSTVKGFFTSVPEGYVGLHTRFKAFTGTVHEPGLTFKTPFIEDVVAVETRLLRYDTKAAAASSDSQDVFIDATVNYRVPNEEAAAVFTGVGLDYRNRIIEPAVQGSIKAQTAKYKAQEMLQKREDVRTGMTVALQDQLKSHGILIESVNITNIDFNPEYKKRIEEAAQADQDARTQEKLTIVAENTAKQRVATAEGDKNVAIAKAQGEAEATRIVAEALKNNPDFLKLKELEVQLKWAEKWGGVFPQYLFGGGASMPALPLFNLNK